MNKTIVSRREFLKWVGVAGVSAVGISLLDEYRPWVDLNESARFSEKGSSVLDEKTEIIRLATLAASSHNTQPWKFTTGGEGIQIHPDYSRRLPVVDPQDRELWISLGCALENLLIAAGSHGYSCDVDYPEKDDWINVHFTGGKSGNLVKNELYDAIFQRQNTRSEYIGRYGMVDPSGDFPIPLISEPGIILRYITGKTELNTLCDLVKRGTLAQYSNKAFLDELNHWLRFNKKEALSSMDGLYSRCSGNPEVPRFIGQWFVSTTDPVKQAEADIRKLQSSEGVLVIASDGESFSDWIRSGQVYERWALKMTALGIRSSLLNQPVEVMELREELANTLALNGAYPQMLIRYGRAPEMPRSLRRPVDRIMI